MSEDGQPKKDKPAPDFVRAVEVLSQHIFAVSAAMVGVCLTAIGLVQVVISSRHLETFVDDLLVADALFFLSACVLAYASLRARDGARSLRLEGMADIAFLGGLALTVVVCCGFAYSL